jgi:mRNA interferase MazF
MKRGDLVMAVLPGAYGKPRPVVIIQADMIEQPNSVTFLPLINEIICDPTLRITIDANSDNGLQCTSQVMMTGSTQSRANDWAKRLAISQRTI